MTAAGTSVEMTSLVVLVITTGAVSYVLAGSEALSRPGATETMSLIKRLKELDEGLSRQQRRLTSRIEISRMLARRLPSQSLLEAGLSPRDQLQTHDYPVAKRTCTGNHSGCRTAAISRARNMHDSMDMVGRRRRGTATLGDQLITPDYPRLKRTCTGNHSGCRTAAISRARHMHDSMDMVGRRRKRITTLRDARQTPDYPRHKRTCTGNHSGCRAAAISRARHMHDSMDMVGRRRRGTAEAVPEVVTL